MNNMNRKHKEKDQLLKKLKKLEKKIQKLVSDDEESECEVDVEEEHLSPPLVSILMDSPTRDCSPTEILEDDDAPILDESILNILGSMQMQQKGSILRKEIASRWTEVIANGLQKEEKENIGKSNLPFENFPELCAPKLNLEVKAALPDSAKKRDQIIESRQKQISTVLSCLGLAIQGCINGADIKEILDKISQASRLLCDTFHLDSKSRRSLILFCINQDMKESLLQTKPEEYLFGKDLSEIIKTAKTVQKSVQDLKVPQKKNIAGTRNTDTVTKGSPRALNWWGPPRQNVGTQKPVVAGGQTYGGKLQTKKKDERPQERQPNHNFRR